MTAMLNSVCYGVSIITANGSRLYLVPNKWYKFLITNKMSKENENINETENSALNIADVMLSLPTLQEVEDAVKTYSNGTTDNERDKKLISDAYRIGAYWAINTICRGNGA